MPYYGGGSSGGSLGATVEITEIETLAKGSLIVGDGTGAPRELTAGANGTVLVADSTADAGQTARALTKSDVSLGNVDNTSDANKPVSTAQQTALNLKANIASPTFTGTVGGITAAMVGAPSGSGTCSGTNTGDQTLPIDSTLTFTDITTNNASTTKHGFCPKLDNVATNFLNGQGGWSAPAGGVTGFTGSQNTSSPNNTVNASQLLVSASSTNADIVLSPKGTGSVLAHLPDSSATGGNKRGVKSVDLQTYRLAAGQVSSGYASVICGGGRNTSSDAFSFIGGGQLNVASADASVVCGGRSNTASGIYSVCVGGKGNTVSGKLGVCGGGYQNTVSGGTYARTFVGGGRGNTASNTGAAVLGGYFNTASGTFSSVPGGRYGTTRGISGMSAIASGRFGTDGDAQRGQYILRGLTTNGSAKVLTADQGAASTTNQVVLPNNSGYTFNGMVHCHRTDSIGTSASFTFAGAIRRGANAASTTLVAAVTPTSLAVDAGGVTWALAVTADTTNGCLKVEFTGEASKTIRTVCVIETVEVTS